MTRSVRRTAPMLIALGLIGMALYAILQRVVHPAFLTSDAAHGAWVGVCLGLELVGVALLVRSRRPARAA